MALVVRVAQDVVLDQVTAVAYGDPRSSMLEAVRQANPHLWRYPLRLPRGVHVLLPDLPGQQPSSAAVAILWD